MRRARHPIISPAPRGRRKSDLDQLRLLRRGGDRGPVLIFLARIVSFSTTSGREPGVRLPHPGIFSYLTTRRKGIRCSCSSLLWTRTTRGLDPPAPHRQHSGAFFILRGILIKMDGPGGTIWTNLDLHSCCGRHFRS